ncbi:hypothetical protein ACFUEN_29060 [Streptomyces griseorubiginosus]|uniref:hypothetical protein n=1 Tax=Streptomyces griseorubiginosus TaxID=67304 RepID=UPI0036458F0D
MPDPTDPSRGGSAPLPPPYFFRDVIRPLSMAEEAGRWTFASYDAVTGTDRWSAVGYAIGAFRVAIMQICDSRRAKQVPLLPAETAARLACARYAHAHGGSSEALRAEALGALRTALACLLTPESQSPGREWEWQRVPLGRFFLRPGAYTRVWFALGLLRAECTAEGCEWTAAHSVDVQGLAGPAERDEAIDRLLPEFLPLARSHAESCQRSGHGDAAVSV